MQARHTMSYATEYARPGKQAACAEPQSSLDAVKALKRWRDTSLLWCILLLYLRFEYWLVHGLFAYLFFASELLPLLACSFGECLYLAALLVVLVKANPTKA